MTDALKAYREQCEVVSAIVRAQDWGKLDAELNKADELFRATLQDIVGDRHDD